MTPDDERLIETYLRRPDTLSASQCRAVEERMGRDRAASAYAAFLVSFYDLLDDESRRAPAAPVEAFVDNLFGGDSLPAVVPVRPFQVQQSSRPTVLAAATAQATDDRRYSVLTTLAAADEDVLVRVIGDREAGRARLYVLSDPPEGQSHVVVSFPDLGLDLVTDAEGRLTFDLPRGVGPTEWNDASAVVRRPVATGRLMPESTRYLDGNQGTHLRCTWEDETLTVSQEDAATGSALSLLTTEPANEPTSRTLHRLDEDPSVHHVSRTEGGLVLRVYE